MRPRPDDTPATRCDTLRPVSSPASRNVPDLDRISAIVDEILALPDGERLDTAALDPILRRHPRDGRGFHSRSELIQGLRVLGRGGHPVLDPGAAEALVRRLVLRPVRTRSGVTPLTVLTQPHPCPGRCVFCPNDARMPKSYLSDEPGAQRAAENRFDPYAQTWNRLVAFHAIGHPTDKIELIVLGGTWSAHPEPYRVAFATRMFEALNDFGRARERDGVVNPRAPESGQGAPPDFDSLPRALDARAGEAVYNRTVKRWMAGAPESWRSAVGVPRLEGAAAPDAWSRLERAQRANEDSGCRAVGLVFETRPDCVDDAEVAHLRRLGATKIQLGIQSLSDRILSANQRGHDVETSRRAMSRLRRAGFKIHAHWMPNLLDADVEGDARDFARLWSDRAFRPDELKVYPCSLIESAELMRHYESGRWRPYGHDELLDLLARVLPTVPRHCRVTRVIRDISSDDIVAGNKLTNFRELADREIARRGRASRDIRAREIRDDRFDPEALSLRVSAYDTADGREEFLEWTTPEDRLLAFLRLSLPAVPPPAPLASELAGAALIREVHVYGPAMGLGERGREAQHRGLGARLVELAAERARAAGYPGLCVISAVGTRAYYRRLGFADGDLYQRRELGGVAAG